MLRVKPEIENFTINNISDKTIWVKIYRNEYRLTIEDYYLNCSPNQFMLFKLIFL